MRKAQKNRVLTEKGNLTGNTQREEPLQKEDKRQEKATYKPLENRVYTPEQGRETGKRGKAGLTS